jgi:hypothetical protein
VSVLRGQAGKHLSDVGSAMRRSAAAELTGEICLHGPHWRGIQLERVRRRGRTQVAWKSTKVVWPDAERRVVFHCEVDCTSMGS